MRLVLILSAAIRSRGEIVINVVSSGNASLLLPGGKTAHSSFGLPHAELLSRAKVIIWKEAPMMHMYCFEALDKTMKSILHSDMPFGGQVVVRGGDFRQILLVVLTASRQDIVHATTNSSSLWRQCEVMKLNKNMRVQSSSPSANADKIREFAEWILRIGNGDADEVNDDPFLDLIEFVYPDLVSNLFTPEYFEGMSILAPTNESDKVYFSSDSMWKNKILSGKHVSDMVFIPRMTLIPSDSALPIKFQRRLFPLMVSFAMTINKSQGHTISHVGLYLSRHVFSHGQLYVALSRVKSRKGIKIFINSKSGETTKVTNNVVCKEVFHLI
ncbi:hypothetical protein ACP275_06G135800 [Erythranthe tilingii]